MITDTLQTLKFRTRAALAFAGGLCVALSMPPLHLWPLLIAGLSFLFIALHRETGKRALAIGWCFGFGHFLLGLFWIGNALLVPGNEFLWAWPFAVLGLPLALAFFPALGCWAAARLVPLSGWRGYAALTAGLMLSEWLRGHILTGFPWGLYGYGWAGVLPLVQSVSLFGVYGLSFLSILWGFLPGFLLVTRPARRVTVAALCIALLSLGGLYGWGAYRLSSPVENRDDIMVRVVQPNIAQEDKWNGNMAVPNLQKLVWNSSSDFLPGKRYAIIWPETAITDYIAADPNASDFIRSEIFPPGRNGYLFSGVLRHATAADGKPAYFNSLVAYDRELQPAATYDKSHLVPFGEYIPFQRFIPLRPVVQFSGFTPGDGVKTAFTGSFPGFSALICYEVIFPGRVAKKAPAPEWIINATNDGWYGDSPGPYQHLAKAIFRAVEEGVPLVRSANTGISAIINPHGRVLGRIGYNTAGYIDAPLPRPVLPQTPYSRYGDFFTYALFLSLLCFIWITRRG